jgi:hypothetical protein
MIQAIKKYLFYRKVRWYRKDEMTMCLCKHRLTTKKAYRIIRKQEKLIKSLDRTITIQDDMIKKYEELTKTQQYVIDHYENPPKVVYKALSGDGQWELRSEN